MSSNAVKNPLMKKERLEFFSDGVFAIAITLLVLEIKIPKHAQLHEMGGLYNYLVHIWPAYLSYFLSFITLGIYWSNHHHLFSFIIKKTDHYFNLLNVVFLMTIAFIPFTTAVFGDYFTDHEYAAAAITTYCLGFLMPPVSLLFVFAYAFYKSRLTDPDLSPAFIKKQFIKLSMGVGFGMLSLLISFYYPMVALGMILVGFFLYFAPPDVPVYTSGKVAVEE